jgi:hypothetical protein
MLRAEFETDDEEPIAVKVFKTGLWDKRYDEYVDATLRDRDVPILEYNRREGLVGRDAEEVTQLNIESELDSEMRVIKEWMLKETRGKKNFRIVLMD